MDKTDSITNITNNKSEFIIVDNEDKKNKQIANKLNNQDTLINPRTSLQDNFRNFLKQRKEIRKTIDNNDNTELKFNSDSTISSFRTNPERMKTLRTKFIEQAISYLGIPYGRRYVEEDNPLYDSPLFLDCCGLIRQCVNDLSEDFGFRLGRFNQAYQYDILPDLIEFKDLQPGDLIFYQATFNKGWKLQPHDMVHVEIYVGDYKNEIENTTGIKSERTIAAREKRGVVQFFDTYQFTSDNYYDIKYSFKSIDPWLKGIHKSYCLEHEWKDDLSNLNKNNTRFSVFSNNQENDCAEEKDC